MSEETKNSSIEYKTYDGSNVLIIGGQGFIGSNLAHVLLKLNSKVTVVDSLDHNCGSSPVNFQGIEDKITFHQEDICNKVFTDKIVRGQKYIYNFAGQLDHHLSLTDPLSDQHNNATAALTLLQSCVEHNPEAVILYAGTRGVYGNVPQKKQPVTENVCPLPLDINGANKLAADYYHQVFHKVYNLKTIVLRLTNTYGPRQSLKTAGMGFITQFLKRAFAGKSIEIYGSGEQKRDMMYVWDVLNAFVTASLREECFGNIYNLAGETLSIRNVAKKITERVQSFAPLRFRPYPEHWDKIEIGNYKANDNRFRRDAKWTRKIDFDKGLEETIAFYLNNNIYKRYL